MDKKREDLVKRLERNKKKMMTVKADQVGLCRFVAATVQDFAFDINDKYVRCGSHVEYGLQYENILVLPNGSFKYVNNPSLKIITVYEGVPEWANDYLRGLHLGYFFYDEPVAPKVKGDVRYA